MLKGDATDQNDELKSILDLMEISTERFKKTIETLTDIAKIQKDINDDIEEVSFEDIFKEVLPDIKDIKETNAKIKTDFKQPTIKFSKKNLRSILYNLLVTQLNTETRTEVLK